jgi:DinB superfamily
MPLDDEQTRIRGYLQSQAAKLSIADLTQKVKADMVQVHEAAAAVPGGRFSERPAPGEWSANEVMAHIVSGAAGVGQGIIAVLDSGATPGPVFDRMEKAEQTRTANAWWDTFTAERETLFARVGRASGDEHLDITWDHPMFGPLNWREWLLFLRIHDVDHAKQMQAVTAALGG